MYRIDMACELACDRNCNCMIHIQYRIIFHRWFTGIAIPKISKRFNYYFEYFDIFRTMDTRSRNNHNNNNNNNDTASDDNLAGSYVIYYTIYTTPTRVYG